jgi:MFS family permease
LTARSPLGTYVDRGDPAAVTVVFATAGFLSAAAFTRMPSLRDQVDASFAEFSIALLCVGLGSVLAMPWSGRLTDRFSSGVTVRVFGVVACSALAAAGFLPTVAALGGGLLLFGVGIGVWDVSMNVQGHAVESRQRRVLMPGWHAAYSFGAVGGALFGAVSAWVGLSVRVQLPATSLAALILLLVATSRFIDDSLRASAAASLEPPLSHPAPETPGDVAASHADHAGDHQERPEAERRGITGVELVLGVIVLCTAIGEGAANDWLGLLLVDERGLPEAFGGAALAGFNLTMGVGRLVGGRLITRFGRVLVLRVSGLLATAGVLALCLPDSPAAALVGAAAWGLGLAVVFPTGMSAAGDIEGRGARAIAVVSTIGYAGFLLGAPLIGQLTRVMPLERALLVVALAGLVIAALAFVARERPDP